MARLRKLVVTMDFENTRTPQRCVVEVKEYLRGDDDPGKVCHSVPCQPGHTERVSRSVGAKFRVDRERIQHVMLNDGRVEDEKFDCNRGPCWTMEECLRKSGCQRAPRD